MDIPDPKTQAPQDQGCANCLLDGAYTLPEKLTTSTPTETGNGAQPAKVGDIGAQEPTPNKDKAPDGQPPKPDGQPLPFGRPGGLLDRLRDRRNQKQGDMDGEPADGKSRDDKRNERRDRLRNILNQVLKPENLGPMLEKLGEAPALIEGAQKLISALQGVKDFKIGKTPDGKTQISFSRANADEIPVDPAKGKQGPVTVEKIKIDKDISFVLGKDKDGKLQVEDIKGINVKAKFDVGFIKKDLDFAVKTASLDQKDDKPALKVSIENPAVPGAKIPVLVPIAFDAPKKK